jgi:pimeloyl-ACP methyl ester carboxylesterase
MTDPIPRWPGELVKVGAGEVFVRSAPAVDGAEPALFVHGLGGSATNWTDLMDVLRQPPDDERDGPPLACEAVDLPGFGFSPVPADGDYSIDARARAVCDLIDQRGNWPVHLIGNSMGGAVSVRVAARRPDLVRSLTLISPALPDLRPRLLPLRLAVMCTPGAGTWLLNRALRIPPEARTSIVIKDCYADPALVHPVRVAEEAAELARRDELGYAAQALLSSARGLVAEYMRRGRRTLWRDARKVTAPTLVIYGSHDRLVRPAMAALAARSFRNARVVVLPRMGHVAMMERPDLVAKEMRGMLGSAARSTAVRHSVVSHEAINHGARQVAT